MCSKFSIFFQRFKFFTLLMLLFSLLVTFTIGCSKDTEKQDVPISVPSGVFGETPISGVTYTPALYTSQTDEKGTFYYNEGTTVTFSIGNLSLGSALGQESVTPVTLVGGDVAATDQHVQNMLVLLYTLDQDGDLNNGVQITPAITAIVSAAAAGIDFNQTTTAFAADTDITGLVTSLNSAAVFSDTYRGNRTLTSAAVALAVFQRATGERKVISTQYGIVKGFESSDTTWQFLGVPYATPPIGNLRWRETQAPSNWEYRDAVQWGDKCPQDPSMLSVMGEGGVSENCLYLNITIPKGASDLPVMVWFHGGGFVMGSANSTMFNNANGLPTKGVVLVTVTHRLGVFGYNAHSLLEAESANGTTGNYGQLDLIAALQWVHNNIEAFGGDPANVTIFGQSGGCAKVMSLMCSTLATDLFHKAIGQSGMAPSSATGGLNGVPLATAETTGTDFFTSLGVATLAEARAKTATEVEAAGRAAAAAASTTVTGIYGPVIDTYYISANIYDSIAAGLASDVPFVTGATNGDTGMIPLGVLEQMPLRYQYCTSAQYVYRFDKAPSGWETLYPGIEVGHGGELKYIYNYPAGVIDDFFMGGAIDPATSLPIVITPPTPSNIIASAGWDASDATTVDNIMTMWTNFAKTGNPSITSGASAFTWPAYTGTTGNNTFVVIDAPISVQTDLSTGY